MLIGFPPRLLTHSLQFSYGRDRSAVGGRDVDGKLAVAAGDDFHSHLLRSVAAEEAYPACAYY